MLQVTEQAYLSILIFGCRLTIKNIHLQVKCGTREASQKLLILKAIQKMSDLASENDIHTRLHKQQ